MVCRVLTSHNRTPSFAHEAKVCPSIVKDRARTAPTWPMYTAAASSLFISTFRIVASLQPANTHLPSLEKTTWFAYAGRTTDLQAPELTSHTLRHRSIPEEATRPSKLPRTAKLVTGRECPDQERNAWGDCSSKTVAIEKTCTIVSSDAVNNKLSLSDTTTAVTALKWHGQQRTRCPVQTCQTKTWPEPPPANKKDPSDDHEDAVILSGSAAR
mmetsp:Transcript_1934/g.4370  ORF Transcript_1934/g.4370 Transcript_1934/m.4370 type:complete len:213 (-) Transcript_1934:231-869(-)